MAEQPIAPGPAESAAEGPQRRRLPPDERRSEIFSAALKVFSELGYDRATLNDVVERVGVSKGCLYHHFESKERLLMELLREKVSTVQAEEEALSAAAGTREEVLRSLVDRMWQHLEEPGRIEFAKLLITELPKVPDAARYMFEEFAVPKREMMRKVLEREGTGGRMSEPDAETTAIVLPWMILGVALGLHAFRGIDPSEISYQQVGRVVADVIVKGVGGVSTEGPGERA